jgi:ABC-type antimicrobial peptide transport system permease subunit
LGLLLRTDEEHDAAVGDEVADECVCGVVAGGAAAALLGRFVETQLYSVQPLDIVSFAATAGVMIATAFIASVVPALRTLRIDPINALRGE